VGIRQLNVLYSQRLHNSSIANSSGQVLLGSKGFARQFKDSLKEKENLLEIPRQQHYVGRPDIKEIFVEGGNTAKKVEMKSL